MHQAVRLGSERPLAGDQDSNGRATTLVTIQYLRAIAASLIVYGGLIAGALLVVPWRARL